MKIDEEGGEAMATEARRAQQAEWDAANTTQIKLKLNNKQDADILEKLKGVPSKQGYIKKLIRADIAESGK